MNDWKKTAKKVWKFIWEDDSALSWIVNVILAFIIIKFLVYPVLGFMLATSHPIVAVVSGSMEHAMVSPCIKADINGCQEYDEKKYSLCDKDYEKYQKVDFDLYWEACGEWYETNTEITKKEFQEFRLSNGFNKGDIIVIYGTTFEDVKVGETIVFWANRADPIIHRVIKRIEQEETSFLRTKGDHNSISHSFEQTIPKSAYVGKAVFRIPYLGWIKIMFVDFIRLFVR